MTILCCDPDDSSCSSTNDKSHPVDVGGWLINVSVFTFFIPYLGHQLTIDVAVETVMYSSDRQAQLLGYLLRCPWLNSFDEIIDKGVHHKQRQSLFLFWRDCLYIKLKLITGYVLQVIGELSSHKKHHPAHLDPYHQKRDGCKAAVQSTEP